MTASASEKSSLARTGRLIIVCGLPGSGKTTEAKQVAVARSGLRLSPDDWLTALGANLWDSAMRERVESLQWSVAKELLRLGSTVIIEWGTWSRAERDRLRQEARVLGASVELRYVYASPDELWHRIRARGAENPPIERQHVDEWVRIFEEPDREELRLYDPPP